MPRILVAEDEFLIRMVLAEMLGDAGFEVIQASSGEEAVGLLRSGEPPALILTDVNMPGALSGIDLVRQARAAAPEVQVIFTTGRGDALAEYGPLGANDRLVQKPYSPTELVGMIERLLRPDGA
jgi:CheY-like chemotaxis protein